MKDILERLADSHSNEGSHDLQCRCFDAAEEISRLRVQRDELLVVLKDFVDNDETPDRNCSCHISPPCNDCVDFSWTRELIETARAAIANHEPKP